MTGFNREVSTQRLLAHGVSPGLLRAVEVQDTNLGTPAQRAAMLLFIIPWLALIVGITGCMAVAIDMTAGERERGSLEPLLMNPIARPSLILGKWLAVACYGMGIVLLLLAGFAAVRARHWRIANANRHLWSQLQGSTNLCQLSLYSGVIYSGDCHVRAA